MAKTINPIVEDLINEDPYSSRQEQLLRKELREAALNVSPYESDRSRAIIKKIMAGDNSDTPYTPEHAQANERWKKARGDFDNFLKGKYDALASKLGRKSYEGFTPHDRETDGSKDITGPDRLYALYEYALKHDLDFGKVLAGDLESYPDRGIPKTLEFSNDKFELFPGRIGGDHWRKATKEDLEDYKKNGDRFGEIKDGWRHISTGTNYGSDIADLLAKENFK